MPVLAYCIAENGRQIETPPTGVRQMPVETATDSGLLCFFSNYSPVPPADMSIREIALEFHQVLRNIFRQVTIIPFRFPTVLSDSTEVSAFLSEHRDEYLGALTRLKDKVQIDVRVSSPKPSLSKGDKGLSGTEYLREQQARQREIRTIMEEIQNVGEPWIESWRERETPTGVRGFALVGRESVKALLGQIESVRLSKGISAQVTGPWPATEFVEAPDVR